MDSLSIDITKKYLLFFDRNKKMSWDFYNSVVKLSELKYFRTISEYKGCDYYINIANQDIDYSIEFWDIYRSLNFENIINRCRLLRSIENEKARILISKTLSYYLNLFKNNSFDTIIMFSVDRYTLHLLTLTAKHFNIQVLGIGGSFIKNTKRITLFGEHQKIRETTNDEVDALYFELCQPYNANGKPSKKTAIKNFIKLYLSNFIRFILHYLIFHKICGSLQYDHLLVKFEWRKLSILNFITSSRFFDIKVINDIRIDDIERTVYIPLHYHPEATVDYWTDESYKAYYLESLCEILTYYRAKNLNVFLKEHPAMYLIRENQFYRKIKKFGNVQIIDPFIETVYLLPKFRKVIIWTGTTGIEALVNMNNVYLYSENFWSNNHLPHWKQYTIDKILDKREVKVVLKRYLDNLVHG